MRETEIKTPMFGNEMLSFFVMCVRNIHESYGPLVYTWPNSKINTGSHFYRGKRTSMHVSCLISTVTWNQRVPSLYKIVSQTWF